MHYSIFRRGVAVALIACLSLFVSCVEDRNNFTALPSGEADQPVDVLATLQTPDYFPVEEYSEENITATFTKFLEAAASLPDEPSNMGDMIVSLKKNSKLLGEDYNTDFSIAAYEQAWARRDEPISTPLEIQLNKIFAITTNPNHTPATIYQELEEYKQDFIANIPAGFSNTDANVVVYDINMQKSLLKIMYYDQFSIGTQGKDLDAAVKLLKTILGWFGLTIDLASELGLDPCSVAIAAAIASLASCLLGSVPSCISLILLKVPKAFKVCSSTPIPYCTLNPSPCCGIVCIQGYECDYTTGECEFVPDFDNCDNCLPGEECVDGFCQPF